MKWWDAVKSWIRSDRKKPFPNDETPETVFSTRDDFVRKRVNLATVLGSRDIAAEWDPKLRVQAFFSARVSDDHVLSVLRSGVDDYLSGKLSRTEARAKMRETLVKLGYSPHGGLKNLASISRMNLILDTNYRMAQSVGMWQQGMDPDIMARFPCWRYIGSTSAAKRDAHAAYAGKVFRKDDPVWHKIFPPSDFGCKCSVEDSDDPPDDPPREIVPPDSGFAFDPAHAFEKFDLTAIKDAKLREQTREGLAKLSSEPEYGKINTGVKSYDDTMRSFLRKAPHPLRKLSKMLPPPNVTVEKDAPRAKYFDGKIVMSPESKPKNCIHEWAHCVDDKIISKNPELRVLKNVKMLGILDAIKEKIRTDESFKKKIEQLLMDAYKRKSEYESTISDLFGAATYNEVGNGHEDSYWTRSGHRQNEAFAQLTVLYGKQTLEWRKLQELTPELAKCYQEIISKASVSMI